MSVRHIFPINNNIEWHEFLGVVDEAKYEELFKEADKGPGFRDAFQQAYAKIVNALDEKDYARYITEFTARKLE